jgi:hypothetical protein
MLITAAIAGAHDWLRATLRSLDEKTPADPLTVGD